MLHFSLYHQGDELNHRAAHTLLHFYLYQGDEPREMIQVDQRSLHIPFKPNAPFHLSMAYFAPNSKCALCVYCVYTVCTVRYVCTLWTFTLQISKPLHIYSHLSMIYFALNSHCVLCITITITITTLFALYFTLHHSPQYDLLRTGVHSKYNAASNSL